MEIIVKNWFIFIVLEGSYSYKLECNIKLNRALHTNKLVLIYYWWIVLPLILKRTTRPRFKSNLISTNILDRTYNTNAAFNRRKPRIFIDLTTLYPPSLSLLTRSSRPPIETQNSPRSFSLSRRENPSHRYTSASPSSPPSSSLLCTTNSPTRYGNSITVALRKIGFCARRASRPCARASSCARSIYCANGIKAHSRREERASAHLPPITADANAASCCCCSVAAAAGSHNATRVFIARWVVLGEWIVDRLRIDEPVGMLDNCCCLWGARV